ncbi:ribonucleoside triphosphate reductase [bacterium]|nr:MAG: ribonucleoside triphosphate reductase [bacterium]
MERLVRKRDGKIVEYDRGRIVRAVRLAMEACEVEGDPEEIAKAVEIQLHRTFFRRGSIPHVEEIQDLVERTLMERGFHEVAKAYILYRQKRKEARELKSTLEEAEKLIEQYISREDWRVNENSNMNYSLQGLNFYISSSITARYWLNRIYTEDIKRAHDDGDFHIHDLGILGPYCVGWDLEELLRSGFRGVEGKIESAPAKHFRTALGQVVNFFYTLQGEAAGAQAFSNFDTLLAPFIRYDRLSYKEVKQAMQEFLFNLNVPTRVGFQTPFTNITMDLTVPEMFKDRPVIWAGREMENTYGDFQDEMNMINRAFAELMMEGDAKGRIFTFPIPTYNISKDFDWENENLEPIWEMTGKYGIPYFSNFVNSDMKPEDARSMCCRLRLDNRELRKRGGGLFGANPLTGSIGVVTINLPRIGYLSRTEEEFFERLEHLMILAKNSLEMKRKVIEDLTEKGLYPYSRVYLRAIKESQGRYWANHFSTIGLVGMNEACMNFLGVPISTPEGKEWAIKVLKFMREKLSDFQEETGNFYNLEATPAEGASYRLAKKDKERFSRIYTQGDEDAPYYTNSVHLPVNEEHDIFELLEHQDDLQVLFTGGTVVHLFLGEPVRDWRVVRDLVRSIVTNFRLPYFSITPTFSICPVHGYIPGEHEVCPYPHTEEQLRRYGVVIEMDEEELSRLPQGAYVIEDGGEKKTLYLDI